MNLRFKSLLYDLGAIPFAICSVVAFSVFVRVTFPFPSRGVTIPEVSPESIVLAVAGNWFMIRAFRFRVIDREANPWGTGFLIGAGMGMIYGFALGWASAREMMRAVGFAASAEAVFIDTAAGAGVSLLMAPLLLPLNRLNVAILQALDSHSALPLKRSSGDSRAY